VESRRCPLDHDERVGILDGQGLQDRRIDEAEDGGVRAEADRERENDGRRERRRLAKLPQPIASVLQDGIDPLDDAHGTRLFF
jgi:hypothetical protein